MTTPGGDGTAYVTIVADVTNFERDLERHLRRIMKKQGQQAGELFGKNLLLGFRRQIRADLPKYALLGAQAGRSVRKGFQGEKFGRLAAKDFLRGVRRELADADLNVGATPRIARSIGPITGSGGGAAALLRRSAAEQLRIQQGLARDLERISRDTANRDLRIRQVSDRAINQVRQGFLRAEERAAKAVERVRRESAKRIERDEARRRKSLRGIAALPSLPGGGLGNVFSQKGALKAAAKLSPLLVPGLASLFQAARNATGALFGLFPAITGAAGLFALFQGENKRLNEAIKPVVDSFNRVRVNLDGIAAAAAQGGFKVLAKDIKNLQPGLEAFAKGFGDALGGLSANLAAAGAGGSLSRALASIGAAFQALTSGPGLTGFIKLLLRINEQVAARLPKLFLRLQGFLNGLNEKFATTNFGAIFERGVQAVVDFAGAVINLLRVFNAFFAAVSGNRDQGTFFATLRQRLGDLVTFLQQPGTKQSITDFFDAMRELGSAIVQVIVAIGPAIGKFLAITASFISWLQASDLLVPVLVGVAVALGGIAFAAAVAGAVAFIAALSTAALVTAGVIIVLAALVAAIVYANTSTSDFANVIRTVLNAAFLSIVAPIRLALAQIAIFLRGVANIVEAASHLPLVGDQFKNVALGIRASANATDALNGSIESFVTITGPEAEAALNRIAAAAANAAVGLAAVSPGDLRIFENEASGATAAASQLAAAEAAAAQAASLQKLLSGLFQSTGPRATGGGTTAATKTAKQAVDLTALLETVVTRLRDSLAQGGRETEQAFSELRKTIISSLKGTLQEGRTTAVLAFLARQRSGAIAAARSYDQISAAVEKTRSRLADLRDEQNSFRDSVRQTLQASASIAEFLSARPGGSAASFTRFLTKDVAKLEKFQANLATLLKRGLDPALVRELAAGGLDNAKFAGKLAAASPGQLALINALQKQVNALAAQTANLTASTFNAGIKRVADTLVLQLAQQKRQEQQLNKLASYIVSGISAAIRGKPLPRLARGGLTNGPSVAGEVRPELVLPIHDRRRSDELLARHYQPQATRTYTSSFTINAQPGQDPRAIAAAVDRRLASQVR